jgi:hypothetical protein
LAHVFNALSPETPVKKFENREVALRRVGLRLIDIARGLSETVLAEPPTQEKDEMAREAKIGKFKPVGRTTHIGKIIAAHQDGTTNIDDIAALTGSTAEQAIGYLRGARKSNGIDHAVGKETRELTLVIPEGIEIFKAAAAPQEKTPRAVKYGNFSQVRADSRLGKIIAASPATAADIADLVGPDVSADDVLGNLRRARVSHGIDHAIDEDGVVSVFAYQMPEDTVLIRPPAEPKAKREPSGAPKAHISDAAVITLLVEKNPKRPTAAAWARFELYRSGQTVAEFLAAGGTKGDLSWDRVHDFIRIDEVQAQAAE